MTLAPMWWEKLPITSPNLTISFPQTTATNSWPWQSVLPPTEADFDRMAAESEYPEPNTPDDVPGDAGVPEEPNTDVRNDPVPDGERGDTE